MIRFQCPTCLKNLKAPDDGGGHKTHCPRCGQRLFVPPPFQAPARNKTIMGQPQSSPPEWLDEFRAAEGKSKPPSEPQQPSGHALFECPTCHTTFNIPEQMIGRMVDCPKCQTTFAALSDDDAQDNVQFDSFANYETKARRRSSRSSDCSGLDESIEGSKDAALSFLKRHSGLGIASFLVALMVVGLECLVILAALRGIVMVENSVILQYLPVAKEVAFHAAIGAAASRSLCILPVCLVGGGLAVAALVVHKDRRHSFTWFGLLGNGIVALIGLVWTLWSMIASPIL